MPLDLSGIKAATFNTPTNYIESVEYYKQNLQDKINDTYQFASDTFEIEQEVESGTMNFVPIVCRVCHAIEPKTGLNLGDDFKDLKFFDVFSQRKMGERYRFENSIWITTNTDNYHYATQSAIIRRCNNTLKFIDGDGNIVREPCIVGYSVKYANIYYNTTTEVPQSTIVVTAQNNKNTEWIQINDRFIFDKQVFKVKSVKDYLRDETYESNRIPLIEFEFYKDAISPDDNFELGITNMDKYKDIYPPKIPTVKNGIYIEPEIDKIYQFESQKYSCYKYINDIKQDTKFTFVPSGPDGSNYNLQVLNGNEFSIDCVKMSKKPLTIKCDDGVDSKYIVIDLRGLF